MRKTTLVLLLPALFAGQALAGTVESCPNPREIQNTNGVLVASTEQGKGQWLGILRNPKASVTSFASAIFYPMEGKVDGLGTLRACTFNSTDNQPVDMRYRPDVSPDIAIRVKWATAWERREGPFGRVYFECTSQDLQGCAFEEAR